MLPPARRKTPKSHQYVEPVSDLDNYKIVTIRGMEVKYYNAAMQGKIDVFEGMGSGQIESILTPNKNTILHVHFNNHIIDKLISQTFVEKVLGMCPSLVLKTNVKDETVLHIAARYGRHEIVKKLIDHAKGLPKATNEVGTKERLIRAINDKKDMALHEAACYDHEEVVGILINEEPDHSYFGKNVYGETPFYIAVERQHWNVVDKILDNSTSPKYKGPSGRTALHAAVLHTRDQARVSKLLTKNLSATKEADENGWVPLHLAAMYANKGRTGLHFAALRGADVLMKMIITYCQDCYELVDENGSNALHYTAMLGDRKYLDFQIDQQTLQDALQISIMCNEKDDDGNTPLHLLARLDIGDCNHLLLDRQFTSSVDKMAFNNDGQTAIDIAADIVPPEDSYENKTIKKLLDIGAKRGGQVLCEHRIREKKQEKRHDPEVHDEKEDLSKWQANIARVEPTLSVVAILIATVTFTAGFTLPGGLQQDKGSPILKYNAAFIAFAITDSLSFVLSTYVVFLLMYMSAGRGEDFEIYRSLFQYSWNLTLMAMGFMILAFGTGIFAVLGVSKGFGVIIL